MSDLRQGTAVTIKWGTFVDEDDGKTPETGLTIQKADVRLSKNGGNYAAANADQGVADAGAPHDEGGDYDGSVDATDTGTLGRLRVQIQMAGALPYWRDFEVITANAWDSKYGSDKLQVDIVQGGGANIPAGAIPAAAADAAGGLPVSDAGGLDLDAKLANTNEVTAARMGALTDWIDGGRLDLLLDKLIEMEQAIGGSGT